MPLWRLVGGLATLGLMMSIPALCVPKPVKPEDLAPLVHLTAVLSLFGGMIFGNGLAGWNARKEPR
jgi:hypothetical protein